ncbi:MAG: lipopolysaccharide biosynthesis protein [Treponema sp.]|jgi:uncharacterized protein involved in exopolysaccharide biosynthesis|nr:lipopolysaccharide biosynthesis protein [Treponema sp.]
MNEETQKQDDEVSLFDLFAVLWHRKKMIITITVLAVIGAVIFSVISLKLPPEKSFLPNKYTPKALMIIDNKSSSGGGLSSMLNSSNMSSMGGLASLAGASLLSSSSNSQLATFLVGTNSMLDSITDEFDIIKRYKIKKFPRTSSRKELKKDLKADYDSKSGVFTISFTHREPAFARDVVNYCTVYMGRRFDELGLDKNKIEKENLEANIANTFREIQQLENDSRKLEQSVASGFPAGRLPSITTELNRISLELEAQQQVYTQLKVQYELVKVNLASERPVFQILEMAEVPEQKSWPSRGLLCIIVTLAAGFLATFMALAMNAIDNIKNDPEAMAKLRETNEK